MTQRTGPCFSHVPRGLEGPGTARNFLCDDLQTGFEEFVTNREVELAAHILIGERKRYAAKLRQEKNPMHQRRRSAGTSGTYHWLKIQNDRLPAVLLVPAHRTATAPVERSHEPGLRAGSEIRSQTVAGLAQQCSSPDLIAKEPGKVIENFLFVFYTRKSRGPLFESLVSCRRRCFFSASPFKRAG